MNTHSIDELLTKIQEQTKRLRSLCPCGALGQIYADDDTTLLCGKCWLKVYGREAKGCN